MCGGERLTSGGLQVWRGLKCFWSHVLPTTVKGVWEEERKEKEEGVCERQLEGGEERGEERE